MNAIYDLAATIKLPGGPMVDAEYIEKMHHPIPSVPVVSREQFLLDRARGKVVLDIGCTGPMSRAIEQVAGEYWGIDKGPNPGIENYCQVDLDAPRLYPDDYFSGGRPRVDLVIAGEVIEHLSNPGNFLGVLRAHTCPVILTAPNAASNCLTHYLKSGIESVNPDHVAWYSWHTLKTLVERYGFTVAEWFWYNGDPLTAEGLIFCLE